MHVKEPKPFQNPVYVHLKTDKRLIYVAVLSFSSDFILNISCLSFQLRLEKVILSDLSWFIFHFSSMSSFTRCALSQMY